MAAVFVSHASADGALADEVCSWLRSEGHIPFLDRDPDYGLTLGEAWEERLYRELRAADAVVCLLTAAYLTSMWCHSEIGIAKALGSLLLPVRAEPQVDHPLVSADRYQYVDYAADPTAARAELCRRLRRLDAGGGAGWPDDRSPFPGLDPFDPGWHRAFFGRRAEVRALTGRLRTSGEAERGLLVVVGPSGCGKSSLVRAGLLSALANDPDWVVLPALRPGAEPIAALRRDLDKQYHESRVIGQVLESRLAAHYPSGKPRLLWHRIIDLLTIRYFSLIELATDNLRDINTGPEHTGLTSDQLKNAELVLATYYETMALLGQAILTERMSSVGHNSIKLPRPAQDLSPSPLVLEPMAGKDHRPVGK